METGMPRTVSDEARRAARKPTNVTLPERPLREARDLVRVRQGKVPHGGHRGSKPRRATEKGNGAPREAHSDLGGTRWLSSTLLWNLACSAASHADTGPFT